MKTNDLVSKKRQRLRKQVGTCILQAKFLEEKPYIIQSERIENLAKAKAYRAEAEKLEEDLRHLQSATIRQRLAGWF